MGLASRLVALSDRAILRVAGLAGIAAPRLQIVQINWVAASKLPPTHPLKSKLLLQADLAWISAAAGFLLLERASKHQWRFCKTPKPTMLPLDAFGAVGITSEKLHLS